MILMAFSIIGLDFATQAVLNPFESLMADICQISKFSDNMGFLVYSSMSSLGLCIGYLMAAVDWKTLGRLYLGDNVTAEQTAFFLVSIFVIITLIITMVNANERNYLMPAVQTITVKPNCFESPRRVYFVKKVSLYYFLVCKKKSRSTLTTN